jgi:hypothetical protein
MLSRISEGGLPPERYFGLVVRYRLVVRVVEVVRNELCFP